MNYDNTGGRAIMRAIANYGVATIFGIPGTHNLEFYRPLRDLGITPITTRHEQGAGYAADGWSQRTGLPGVVITTSGPGLLNVLSAAGTAFCESRPLLILSPGAPRGQEFADRGVLHETKDPTGAVGSIVLWSRRVDTDAEAVAAIHDAFALFTSGRPRPVHIEVPLDVLEAPATVSESDLTQRKTSVSYVPDDALRTAADVLNAAERPVIIAGGGAIPAAEVLRSLAETLGAPVITTLNGKAAISETHPLSLRAELRLAVTAEYIATADALLVIGSKLGEAELWGNEISPQGAVIRVDLDESRLDTNLPADIRVVGDSRVILPRLTDMVTARSSAWPDLNDVRLAQRAEAVAFSPTVVTAADAITAGIPTGAVVAGDSSQITYYAMTSTVLQEEPKKFLYMPAYATLGYGLPAAIGAAVADRTAPTICVVGDGALMFSVQELATAVEQRLNLAIVCVDNGGYREIRENEVDRGISPIGVDLIQPDWAGLARAFGGSGRTVTAASEVTQAVADAIAEPGVSLVHIPLSIFEDAVNIGASA